MEQKQPLPNRLPIRICSPSKADKKRGFAYELYTTHMLVAFFKQMHEIQDIPFAVLSRKHGICFSWVEYDNYKDDEENDDATLLGILKKQAVEFGGKYRFVYWNHRPMTHDKWVKMLKEAGFDTVESRTLGGVVDKTKPRCPSCKHYMIGGMLSSDYGLDTPSECELGHELEEDNDASSCDEFKEGEWS